MRRYLMLLGILLAVPVPVAAQGAPTSYELRFYTPGAPSPVMSNTLAASAVQCDQAKVTDGSTANPTRVIWDDPADATRDCVWTDPGTGPLFALPAGNYEGTLIAVNQFGASGESNRAPFQRGDPPATRTNLRVLR